MAGPADEIIVRLTADTSGLGAGLQSGADQVQSASAQMAQAAQAVAAQVNEAQASMAEASGAVAEAFDTSSTAMQASMDAAGAAAAQTAAAYEAMAGNVSASTQEAAAAAADMGAAASAQVALLADVAAATAATFDELDAQESALIAAFEAGTLSAADYTVAMDALDAQTAAVATTTAEAATAQSELVAAQMASTTAWVADDAAIDSNTASLAANTAAADRNAASRGGSHGMHGFGVFRAATAVATSAASVPIAVGAVLTGSAAQAQEHIQTLNQAVQALGDRLGVSSSEIDQWAQAVGNSDATIGDAQEVYTKLALSGEFVGHQLQQAGQAAVIFAEMTGTSMSSAAAAVEKIGTDPVSALKYLTGAQQAEIQSLVNIGDAADASRVAIADFDAQMQKAARNAGGDVGLLTEVGDAWDRLGRAVAVNSGGGTDAMKLSNLELMRSRISNSGSALNEGLASQLPGLDSEIAALKAHMAEQAKIAQRNMIEAHIIMPVAGYGAAGLKFDTHQMALHEADAKMSESQRTAYEKSTWAHLLATAPKGSPEYMAAYQHVLQLDHTGAHAAHVSAATHTKNLYDSIWNAGPPLSAAGGAHIAAVHAAAAAEAVQKTSITSQASHSEAMLGMQRSHVQAMASMGTISQSGALAQEQSLADQLYAIKYNEYQKELALAKDKPAAQATVNAELVRAQDTLAQQTQTINDKQSAATIQSWQAVVAPVGQAVSGIVTGYVEGTLTMQQAQLRLGSAIVAEVINTATQSVLHWTAMELAKTGATAAGVATRLALTVAGEAEALAIQAATAIKWILTEAAKAAAGAFSAMAAIPVVGPALAVAAGAATFVAVEALVSNVASAQGGFERVPFDNMPAVLHKDEQVLPAQYAEGLRNLVAGGGGSTYHYHIHANDAAGFEGMLKRNPGALVRALGHAGRTGHTFA
jgi:hypothetical protein